MAQETNASISYLMALKRSGAGEDSPTNPAGDRIPPLV